MRNALFAVFVLIMFAQCKKKSDKQFSGDFLPLSVGTNWTYISNGVTSKLTVTNRDTVALSRTYKVVNDTNGPNQYHGKAGNDYYRFASFQGFLPNGVEELYLKGDQSVNGTWQFIVNVMFGTIPIPVTAKYTIVEKGITKNVQGKNYSDVVHVTLALSSALGNNGGGDFYYAKGIGMISSTLNIIVPGNSTSNNTELVSYEIK